MVQDTVYEEDSQDEKIEDTTDWFALNMNGDVWYFGEIALNYENGVISDIDGSWTAGVEGAKPGITMYFDPDARIGETYRQEFALSEAEDVATIVEILTDRKAFEALAQVQEVLDVLGLKNLPDVFGDGPFLHTKDFAPLEPGVVEDKYYASGIGNILIVKLDPDTEEIEEMEVLETIEGP